MNCRLKSNIKANALVAAEGITNTVKTHVLSADQFKNKLKDTSDIIGADNYEEQVTIRQKMVDALDRIPRFKDFGIVIPSRASSLFVSTNKFINNLMISKEQAVDFINNTLPNSITLEKNGVMYTTMSEDLLNARIQHRLAPYTQTENKKYISVKGNKVFIHQALVDDYNNMRYDKYISDVAVMASLGVNNQPQDFKDETMELRKTPILAHIDSQRHGITQKIRSMKNSGSYDTLELAKLEKKRLDLIANKKKIRDKLTFEMLQEYLEESLATVARDVSSGLNLSRDVIRTHLRTLDLVISSASTNIKDNPLLTISEIKQDDIIDVMLNYNSQAVKLKKKLEDIATAEVIEIAKENISKEASDTFKDVSSYVTVKGISGSIARLMHRVLGIHHIQNPVIQALGKLVEKAAVKTNIITREQGNKLEQLHKQAVQSGFDVNLMIQRDEEGIQTGRLVDVFSERFWSFYKDFKTDMSFRDKYAIHLNPEILFERDENDKDRVELYDKIYEYLGQYMGDLYIKEAKDLWEKYNAIKDDMIKNKYPQSEIDAFIKKNDPILRLQNYKNRAKETRGTDNFLLFIPKMYTEEGQLTGFYEDNYKAIEENEAAFEYYKYARKIFVQNQLELGKFEEKFKPPKLAYIQQSVAELIASGDYAGATRLAYEGTKKEFALVENIKKKAYPKDPITKKYAPRLKQDIPTFFDVVMERTEEFLENDEYYKSLDVSDDWAERNEYRKKTRKRIAKELEEETSTDLLQSLAMANYSTREFIERRAIDTEVNMIKYMLDAGVITTDTADSEQDKKSLKLLNDIVTHYLDIAFYDRRDLSESTAILKNKDKTKGVTARRITKSSMNYARLAVLGWSLPNSLANFGQQFVSTAILAAEGKYFSFGDMYRGYANILTKKKDRNLIDKLFILGDVAYSYEKRTIHEQNKLWNKANPMYIQTATEKINQGAISIALLKSLTVKDENGDEYSLYDVLDENGNLDEKYSFENYAERGVDLMARITVDKIRPVVMKSAGDYLSPLLAEKSEFGKLALMFKKWMPEMLMDRFGGRRFDYTTNEEIEGRMYGLFKSLAYAATGRTEELDEVTISAMLNGLKEIAIVILMKAMFFAASALSCDTPECKDQHPAVLLGLNTLGRVAEDAFGLVSASNILTQGLQPFAIEGTYKQLFITADNFISYIAPGGATGRYQQSGVGFEQGDIKFLENLERLIPFYRANGYRLRVLSTKLQHNPIVTSLINED